MRNRFETAFWRKAYAGLPAGTRRRYIEDMLYAERMELALDSAIEAWSRVKTLFSPRHVVHH